jgi:hypothetical protein
VLGLVFSSTKISFDAVNDKVTQESAKLIVLDRASARYGSQTQELRSLLKEDVTTGLGQISSTDPFA